MASLSNQQSNNPDVRIVKVVGFGRRSLAIIIDGVFIFFASFIITFIIAMAAMVLGWYLPTENWPWQGLLVIMNLLVSLIYYNGKWVQTSGQTFGKMMLGIRIINWDGSPLTTGKMLLRYFGYILNAIFVSLGFIWVAIDKKRRGWHDLIAGTYVVSLMHEYPSGEEVEFVASDAGKSWIWVFLWVFVVLGTETVFFSSLWFLGPTVNNILRGLF